MSFNLALLRDVVARDYTAALEAEYGNAGIVALRRLIPVIDAVHTELAYELLVGGLTILTALDGNDRFLLADKAMPVRVGQLAGLVHGAATLQVAFDGSLVLLPEAVDPIGLSDRAVVYHFDGADNFVVRGTLLPVVNPTGFPSVWGVPTFVELESALEHYRDNLALYCRCPLLQSSWQDSRRWLFRNKPEDVMQASLHLCLVSTLRGAGKIEVRREQPTGGKKPPDIKITWTLTNRLAYVEVKWIGASVHASEPRLGWQPDEAEANRGAMQLAGYLDDNASESPGHQTKGYLVVFDGRRRNVTYQQTELSVDDALYYLTRDIVYDPDYASARYDFATPMRFYVYPRVYGTKSQPV